MTEHRSRTKLDRAASAVADLPVVTDARVVEREDYDHPVIELVTVAGCDRLPPAVARRLAAFDSGLLDVTTQGEGTGAQYVAVAV